MCLSRMMKTNFNVLKTEMFVRGIECYKCRLLSTTGEKKSLRPKDVRYNIKDKEKAGELADLILKNKKYTDSVIVENNPGDGVLTKALLKKGSNQIKKYCCWETRSAHLEKLKKLQKRFGTDLVDVQVERNTEDDDKQLEYLETSFNNIKDIKSVTYIRVIPAIVKDYSVYEFFHLLKNLKTSSIFDKITPEYFYFFSARDYRAIGNLKLKLELLSPKHYKPKPVFLNHFFDVECIAEVPNSDFTPVIQKEKKAFEAANFSVNKDCRYLLHMVPRLDSIREIDDLHHLKYFLKQLLLSPNERIIPKLESLLPDSGIHLIRQGVTMMDRVRDLEPQSLIQIYKDMKTWPGYENSFLSSVFSQFDDDKDMDIKGHCLVNLENKNDEAVEWEHEAGDLGEEEGHLQPV